LKKIGQLSLALFCLFWVNNTFAETVFTYQSKESPSGTRREYTKYLLELALEATIAKYGPYKLVASGQMNSVRSRMDAKFGNKENYFVGDSVSKDLIDGMGYVSFPIDRGVVGYRVFFVSPEARERLRGVSTLDELKEFTIVQGIGWLDTGILIHNGFKVITGTDYDGLFKMVARNRIDLFPRGANEILREYEYHNKVQGLIYDDTIVLYYPSPRFFFTAKSNVTAIKRIEEGLIISYEDGSLQKLWEKYYQPSIDFVNLKKRRIFEIDNPFLGGVDASYEKYFYRPSGIELGAENPINDTIAVSNAAGSYR